MGTNPDGFDRFDDFLKEWSRRDFMRRMGSAAAFTAFMAGGMEFLAACANAGQGQPTAQVSPKEGGHLTEGNFSDVKQLSPYLISDTASAQVVGLMFDGLLGAKANGDLIPMLATEVPKAAADGLTYTFKLRKDLKWSDGRPLTSDDVLFTYQLHWDPKYKAVNSPRRGDITEFVDSISAPDPQTFVMKTKKVYAPTLIKFAQQAFGVVPKHVLGSVAPEAINTHDFNRAPTVSNGVFKFVKWDTGQQVVLARNDNYWGGKSHLDQYVIKVLPDQTTVANQLKTGEIDFGPIGEPFVDDVKAHADVVDVVTFDVAIFDFYAYQLDPSKPGGKLFADNKVRQALFYALNREQMVKSLYFNLATVATGPVPPVHTWAYNKDAKPKYSFDKKKAEDLLDAAGWKKGASGIREKDGVPFKFEVITNAGNKVREGIVQVFQQQWADIGVQCTPKPIQFTELVRQIQNIRTFDMFMVGFSWGQDPDQSDLWHSRNTAPGGFNGGMYKSPTVDKILDDAVSTLDQNKRKQLYFQLQDAINEEAPAPILTFRKGIFGVNKRVKGLTGGDRGLGTYTQFGNRPWMKDTFVADGK
ncbi:MAG TPA: ABC transporter substrate-binding protein [Candidatus Dormibacteraeota bacterium]|nr:ABC transporter substrate-binding protein [Candidatus Dormibacteraeota bacterium]